MATLVYFVLGAAASGRREIVADLIAHGVAAGGGAAAVLLAEGEQTDEAADAALPVTGRWTLADGVMDAELPAGIDTVFILADGRANPVDQLEALRPWLDAQAGAAVELGRILCVVNCTLAEANPPLLAWYDACIHFSDVVLLARRDGVANKWLSDFQNRYRDQFLPALFEIVKQGKVKNPAMVLEPQARRLTHAFDEDADWIIDGLAEDDDLEVEEGTAEVEVTQAVDPYFTRKIGGKRERELPDIAGFLG